MLDLFRHFISHKPDDDDRRVALMLWFSTEFPISEFHGDDYILKSYIDWSVSLSVPLKSQYLEKYLKSELRPLLITEGIKCAGTENLNYEEPHGLDTGVAVSSELILNEFQDLSEMDSEVLDFKVDAAYWMKSQLGVRLTEELGKTFEVVSSQDSSLAASDYALDTIANIRDIYDATKLEDLERTIHTGTADGGTFKFVTDFGIPAIDLDMDGIFTRQLFGLEAQPGAGKTRTVIGCPVYRAVVLYKQNTVYFLLEQTRSEAEAMMVARHVFTLYGDQVTDKMILKDKVPPELQDKVTAARMDLFESGKYGHIEFIEDTLYCDDFINRFKLIDRTKGPFQLFVVDHMGLFEQRGGKYSKALLDYQIIRMAYRKFKSFCRTYDKAGIAINQFNQKGIDAGNADKEITTDMALGGIEVYRNTDANLAMSYTPAMKIARKRKFSQPKLRSSEGFGSCMCDTRFGICYVYQMNATKV